MGQTPPLRHGAALRASKFVPDEFVESNRAYQSISVSERSELTEMIVPAQAGT